MPTIKKMDAAKAREKSEEAARQEKQSKESIWHELFWSASRKHCVIVITADGFPIGVKWLVDVFKHEWVTHEKLSDYIKVQVEDYLDDYVKDIEDGRARPPITWAMAQEYTKKFIYEHP